MLVSITGTGPNGGSSRTPVGRVYFGIGVKVKSKYHYSTIKKTFKEKTRRMSK